MKLLLCLTCDDIFKIGGYNDGPRSCRCGEVTGQYKEDDWHAWYSGRNAVPIGVGNGSLMKAIVESTKEGHEDSIDFAAFVFRRNPRWEKR